MILSSIGHGGRLEVEIKEGEGRSLELGTQLVWLIFPEADTTEESAVH